MNERFPINLDGKRKTDVRSQFAALCWRRRRRKLRILLITSRDTGRWVLPKGWPMDGFTPAEAAAQEAWEEAGVTGDVNDRAIGVYSYLKILPNSTVPCLATVYGLRVRNIHSDWPERSQRRREWMSARKAAEAVEEPDLRQLILTFDPAAL